MSEFTLIWIGDFDKETNEFHLINPKGLIGMNKDKAIGSIEWTKRTLGKNYPCFIYDPSEVSIFNDDNTQNINLIRSLIK